jgi:hypothetical protein
MKLTTKNTGSRLVRWFSRLNQEKKNRGRWYEVENCCMH